MSTRDIVAAIRAGNGNRYEELVTSFQRRVSGVVLSHVSDLSALDDLVQLTFVEAYTNLDKIDDPDQFGPWVCGIARNICLKWLRSRERINKRNLDYEAEIEVEAELTGSDVERDLADRETRQLVSNAVHALAPNLRDVIVARYHEECTYQAISDRLDIPVSTVQSQLRTAQERLRVALGPIAADSLPGLSARDHGSRIMAAVGDIHLPQAPVPTGTGSPWKPALTGIAGFTILIVGAFSLFPMAPAVQQPEPAVSSPPLDSGLRETLRANLPALMQIYQRYLASDAQFGGVITFQLEMDHDGHIVTVEIVKESTNIVPFQQELLLHIREWQLNPSPGYTRSKETITLPFTPSKQVS